MVFTSACPRHWTLNMWNTQKRRSPAAFVRECTGYLVNDHNSRNCQGLSEIPASMSQDNNAPAAVRATRKRMAPPPPPPPPPTEMAAGADAVEWQEFRRGYVALARAKVRQCYPGVSTVRMRM